MADAVFLSKRDGWLTIVLTGAILVMLLGAIPLVASKSLAAVPGLVLLAVSLTLVLAVLGNTRYVIRGEELVIRSGPFRWTVPIGGIESVSATNDPSSAPALSLDRLKIDYVLRGDVREILVSPREPQEFVAALRARNPKLSAPSP